MKNETFKSELDFIKDSGIRKFTEEAITCLPDYFWRVPASSSGKFHPSYALGDGGLVRHTIAAVTIANMLLGLDQNRLLFGSIGSDCIISALILHDGFKQGVKDDGTGHLAKDHAKICADFLKTSPILKDLTSEENRDLISECVRTHMGQWDEANKPETAHQQFVHMCDYLASRKNILFDFGTRVTTVGEDGSPAPSLSPVDSSDPSEVRIPFGKYKGQTVKEIGDKDNGYLNWIINNLTTIKDPLKEAINKIIAEKQKKS